MSSFLTFVLPQTVHFVIEEKLDSQNQNVISQCARLRAVSFSNLAVKTLGLFDLCHADLHFFFTLCGDRLPGP